MPWQTPTLAQVRANNRDYITGKLREALIPNDVPRVLADANAGNAHLNLQYLDWLARQLLPDTAEQQFLDKWANILLVNADGSIGRQAATYSSGTATIMASVAGAPLPAGSILTALSGSTSVQLQVVNETAIGAVPTSFPVRSLTAGAISNLQAGTPLTLAIAVPGINSSTAAVVSLTGGSDEETDDELRARVLFRLRKPPMGGDADDYVAWAKDVPGVTRAWASPMEMGVGTMTLRFMMDDLRATPNPMTSGFPLAADVASVQAYLDSVRPVTVAELYVLPPIPQPVSLTISNLSKNTPATWAAITTSVAAMILRKARPATAQNGVRVPAQTIFSEWVSSAISAAAGVRSFDLSMADQVMPNSGCIGVLGSIFQG